MPLTITVFSVMGCPHCKKVKSMFDNHGWPYTDISLSEYPEKKAAMLQLTDRLTVPQVFFGNTHVGGAADVDAIASSGHLEPLYKKHVTESIETLDNRLVVPDYPPVKVTAEPFQEDQKFLIRDKSYTYMELMDTFLKDVDIANRTYHFKTYKNCFIGREFISFLMKRFEIEKREEAVQIGQQLFMCRFFAHVCKDHILKDDKLFYRFEMHESPNVLNRCMHYTGVARNILLVVKDAKAMLSQLQNVHMDDNGLIDYKKLVTNPLCKQFNFRTCELQLADFGILTDNEKIACGVNIYNMMIIHAFCHVGVPQSSFARLSFFDNPAYEIGGMKFTLSELENGLLRGNRKAPAHLSRHFASSDPRSDWKVDEPDCRIHFALNCGAKSCPPVKNYTPEALGEELRIAAMAFFEQPDNLEIDMQKSTVFMSKILQWYARDFGKNQKEILQTIAPWLRGQEKEHMTALLLLDSSAVKVRYLPYDWTTNAKNAKTYDGSV